jgi:hypothetical protein
MQHALNELARVLYVKEKQLKEPMDDLMRVSRTTLLKEQIASITRAIEILYKQGE